MKTWKKIGEFIRKFFEEYLSGIGFIAMLAVMFYGVIARYILRAPLKWGLEFESICFMYLVFFGIGLAEHENSTVEFDMLYEKFSKPVQAFCRLVGNLLTVVFFAIAFIPCTQYVFKVTTPSPVLKVPRNYIFFPFVIMMLGVIIRHAIRAVDDIRCLVNKTYIQSYGKQHTDQAETLTAGKGEQNS